ncbi:MAG TPA: hypothetical protein VMB83_15165 [Roseiarcus sp.]|nr:hypothetical protein [Roseiarcus sp.]
MRAPIIMFFSAFLLSGCCIGGYPPIWTANQVPFNAFQAAMRLQVGMPTDIAISVIGSPPISAEAKSCGVAGGYEWPCQLMKFGCCEGNQLLVYIAPTPDGRGAVNSWSVGKGGSTWG